MGDCTVLSSVCYFSASTIDCGGPTPASGVTVLEPHTTTVSSVIVYQCQQSGFAPSLPSSVCGEDGRWSPDPSQVVCLEVPTTPTPTPTPTPTAPPPTAPPTGGTVGDFD